MLKLTVKELEKTVTFDLQPGESVLRCLERHGQSLENPCHGRGTCGKCRFTVISGDAPEKSPAERAFNLTERLACLVYPTKDLTIALPKTRTMRFLEEDYQALLAKLSGDPEALIVFLDLGTTTVQILVATGDGKLLDRRSFLNPQKAFGLDVLTRISYAAERPEHLKQLTKLIRKRLESELRQILKTQGFPTSSLCKLSVVGNPTMIHLFFGVSPESLGLAPYTLTLKDACQMTYSDLNETAGDFSHMKVFSYPLASAYIGSDVLAGAVYCGLQKAAQPELLIDIGTNGELILAKDGTLYAASCATGPALEGMNLSCGMRAEDGAIEDVTFASATGDVALSVIGEVPPVGLCGSGILSVVKEGLRLGLITPRGRLLSLSEVDEQDPRRNFLTEVNGRPALQLTEAIAVTQKDLRQVQLAKTALLAGINALLTRADVTPSDLHAVYIAGQFGYHLHPDILLTCGLLPEVPPQSLHYLGNTALKGMITAAADPKAHEALLTLQESLETVSLSLLDDYDRYFIEASSFPEIKEVQHD